MPNSEELFNVISGESDLENKQHILSGLQEDPEAKEEFKQLKNAWALAASGREMPLYEVESMYVDFQKQLRSRDKSSPVRWVSILRYAAVFILAISLTSLFFYQRNSAFKSQAIENALASVNQEISTNFGARLKFQLADGTTVYLNSGSKLIFPTAFSGENRKVELSGEAFFDVTPNPGKPFIVRAGKIDVKVLGTSFNLKAYSHSQEISTTLVHGKVVLESEQGGVSKQFASLNPSERAVYNSRSGQVHVTKEEELDKFIAWKDGKLVFSNDPIEEMAEKLGIWYNVKVKIDSESLKNLRFTATFTEEPIEQVLELLSKSAPIRYKIQKASRLPDNSFSKRLVILN
ncbi:MAG: FecR domain-containing protein [Prolixibacteraceae bacterium]